MIFQAVSNLPAEVPKMMAKIKMEANVKSIQQAAPP